MLAHKYHLNYRNNQMTSYNDLTCKLFSLSNKLAQRAICFACVNFFLFYFVLFLWFLGDFTFIFTFCSGQTSSSTEAPIGPNAHPQSTL